MQQLSSHEMSQVQQTTPQSEGVDLVAVAIIEHFSLDDFSLDANIDRMFEVEDGKGNGDITPELLDSLDPILKHLRQIKHNTQQLQDILLPYYDPALGAAMNAMITQPLKLINSKTGRALFRDSIDIYLEKCQIVDYGLGAVIKGAISDKRMFKVEEMEIDGERQLESMMSIDKLTLNTWVYSVIGIRQRHILHQMRAVALKWIDKLEPDQWDELQA